MVRIKEQAKRRVPDNQVASSSSLTFEKKRMAWKIINIQDEDGLMKKKKLEKEINDVNNRQIDVKNSFDDLPTEMVMKILKNLDDKNLFRCRLVNRRWSGVASEILQKNGGVEIEMECFRINNKEIEFKGKNEISFKSLVKYFEDSPNFPYSRLRFNKVKYSFFKEELKLLANHGERIKCLILGITGISRDYELFKLAKQLKNLVLHELPNLQEFGIQFSSSTISSKITLFPTTLTISPAVLLPQLKVLHLDESSFTKQSEFVHDLLDAAVNLEKIELFREQFGRQKPIKEFPYLHSLGKLYLLQCAYIDLTPELLSSVKENCTLAFKLKELKLNVHHIYGTKTIWPEAAVFISNLFQSSKDTLIKLNTVSLGFLKNIQLPKFSKLTSMSIYTKTDIIFLPTGLNFKEIFPVLKFLELKLPWTFAFCNFGDMHFLPSLETLLVPAESMNTNYIAQISAMCPNLKKFTITKEDGIWNGGLQNFPEVGKAIWTYLRQLRSLEVYVNVDFSNRNYHAIDSAITGFSKEECKRLYYLIKAEKSDAEATRTTRRNLSILNLKDLKSFKAHCTSPCSKRRRLERSMTCVSENFALKLMDDLTYNIKRY